RAPARDVPAALAAYEAERRPSVESLHRAAHVSLQSCEDTERYMDLVPVQFAFNLLTRSLRITHDNLQVRDPKFVGEVDRWFAARTAEQSGVDLATNPPPPPLFTPFRLRDVLLLNRVVVSPMCQYCAVDGTPNDWHLVHLGARAMGGAGLVFTEMTDVSPAGRISPGCTGMYKPEHVPAWKRVVDFVHGHRHAKIGLQLGHAGRKGSTRLGWEGMDEPLRAGNWEIIAASSIPYFPHSQVPRAMGPADMAAVRDDFVRAARMAEQAGFDIVDVSAGQTVPDAKPVYGRQFQPPFADRVRHEAQIPTMAVGNISSYTDVNTILAAGRADLCVLARAHLWDPYWTRHAAHEM